MQTMGELMAEEEERRLADSRREIAAEDAEWLALPAEERAARIAASAERWEALEVCAEQDDEEDDDEGEG